MPHRALVNRRQGVSAIRLRFLRAIMSRSQEALALGPAVISSGVAITALRPGAFINRSRDCRLTFASLRRRRPPSVWVLRAPPSRGQGFEVRGRSGTGRGGLPGLTRGRRERTAATIGIRSCRPGDPLPAALAYPGLADGQGCRREVRSAPMPSKEIDHDCQDLKSLRRAGRRVSFHSTSSRSAEEGPQDAASEASIEAYAASIDRQRHHSKPCRVRNWMKTRRPGSISSR